MKMKIIVAIWPNIYYLFSFFSKDFKANNDKENLKELIDKIENIYQNKNDIINSLKGQEEKKNEK